MFIVRDLSTKHVILIVTDNLKRNIFLNRVYKTLLLKEIGIV